MPREKEDLRIIKTRKSLNDTFLQMISEQSFEDITVNDLCERAGVRRATFYKHYDDKNEFLMSFVKMYRDSFDKSIWKRGKPDATKEYYVRYVRSLINYLSVHDTIVQNILKSHIRHPIIYMLIQQNYIDTKTNLDKSVEEGLQLKVSTDTLANMLAGGIAVIITKWFEDGKPIPKSQLMDEISAIHDCLIGDNVINNAVSGENVANAD